MAEDPDKTLVKASTNDPDATVIRPVSGSEETVVRTAQSQTANQTEDLRPGGSKSSEDVRVGSVINNRFVIDKPLGAGGMGVVYRALDRRKQEAQDRDPYVAIKILSGEFKAHPLSFVALQREARKSQTLAHPNVITVYDFDRDGDVVYMTMEELKGLPLDKFISEKHPQGTPPQLAVQIIKAIAQGLEYAHSKQIVHSDLKPGNLFITNDNEIKILDFGIARAVSSLGGESGEGTVFDAQELGGLTPSYASAEMFDGSEPHPSDDVYALGLIGYELITGRHPYYRKRSVDALREKLEAPKIKGIIKAHQAKALLGAVALERKNRIVDAHQFLSKFDKTAMAKKSIAAFSLVTIAIVLLAFWFGSIQDEVILEDTDTLASPLREEVLVLLERGKETLAIEGLESQALISFDAAWQLHPLNAEANEGLDTLVTRIIDMQRPGSELENTESLLVDVNVLLSYSSLAANAELLELRESLQAQLNN